MLRRLRQRLCIAWIVVPSVIASSDALADPIRPVDLTWSAPEGCPDRAAIEAAIAAHIASSSPTTTLRAHATITKESDGSWALMLATQSGSSKRERTLRAAECRELGDAAALILAIAIDPSVAARTQSDVPESAAAASTQGGPPNAVSNQARAEPARTATRQPSPTEADHADRAYVQGARAPTEPLRVRGIASASGAVDAAALPSVAPGVVASLGVALNRVRLDAYGLYLVPEDATLDRGAGATIGLIAAGMRSCYMLNVATVALGPCAAFEVGSLSGEGFGVLGPGSGHALWVAPGGGLLGVYPLSRWFGIDLALDVRFPLSRDRFVLSGIGEVFKPALATARAVLGLEASVP